MIYTAQDFDKLYFKLLDNSYALWLFITLKNAARSRNKLMACGGRYLNDRETLQMFIDTFDVWESNDRSFHTQINNSAYYLFGTSRGVWEQLHETRSGYECCSCIEMRYSEPSALTDEMTVRFKKWLKRKHNIV